MLFWRKSLNVKTSFVVTANRRICAIRFCLNFGSLLLVNIYICLIESDNFSNDEFCLQLSFIDQLTRRRTC